MPQRSYSVTQAKKSKTNFYYALRFLPSAKREAIFAVYAFCRCVDDAVDDAGSTQEGERGVVGEGSLLMKMYIAEGKMSLLGTCTFMKL